MTTPISVPRRFFNRRTPSINQHESEHFIESSENTQHENIEDADEIVQHYCYGLLSRKIRVKFKKLKPAILKKNVHKKHVQLQSMIGELEQRRRVIENKITDIDHQIDKLQPEYQRLRSIQEREFKKKGTMHSQERAKLKRMVNQLNPLVKSRKNLQSRLDKIQAVSEQVEPALINVERSSEITLMTNVLTSAAKLNKNINTDKIMNDIISATNSIAETKEDMAELDTIMGMTPDDIGIDIDEELLPIQLSDEDNDIIEPPDSDQILNIPYDNSQQIFDKSIEKSFNTVPDDDLDSILPITPSHTINYTSKQKTPETIATIELN